MDEEQERKQTRKQQILSILFMMMLLAVPIGVSVFRAVDTAKDSSSERVWPEIEEIGSDDEYTYYAFEASHARYQMALDFINEQGGQITSERPIVDGWWVYFEYKVAREI